MMHKAKVDSFWMLIKLALITSMACTSLQVKAQSNWVHILTAENGRKFEVDSSSITKIGAEGPLTIS